MTKYIVKETTSATSPGQHRVTDKDDNDWFFGSKTECGKWVKVKQQEEKATLD